MKYYKVVDFIDKDELIDTSLVNYGLTLCNRDEYADLLAFITESSLINNLPLDFYFSLNNNLATFGDLYLQRLPKSNSGIFEAFTLTNNENHRNIYIRETELIYVVETLNELGLNIFSEGNYLWEYIFENVRNERYPQKPRRAEGFFLFDSLQSCQYYIDKHKEGGMICEVELLETQSLFCGDMELFDNIPNHYTYKQVSNKAYDYWRGNASDGSVKEFIFQGQCKLKVLK